MLTLAVVTLVVAIAATFTSASPATPAAAGDATKAYVPVTPTRVMDTREGLGGDMFAAGESRTLVLAGHPPLPPTGAIAVTLNVTVTQPQGAGFLTVWPSGRERPVASNLNFVPGQTVPNQVTVGLGDDGAVELFAMASTHVVVDVAGWFYGGFNPVTPTRLMDTREGLGGIVLGPGERRDLVVTGLGEIPDKGVGAVALNVTVTEPTTAGYLTVWPAGRDRPLASNLNFTKKTTVPNAVISGVGVDGKISVYNSSGTTQVIVDVGGWFAIGYDAITPSRVMDTREGLGGIILGPGEQRDLLVAGVGDIPAVGVGAVALNVTVVDPTASGFVVVWPAGRPKPLASNLNFQPGQTVPNAVAVGLGADGKISIFNSAGNTDIVVDVNGWYSLSDHEPPKLVGLDMSPRTIDTSQAAQAVRFTVHVTDDLSGLAPSTEFSVAINVAPPSGSGPLLIMGTRAYKSDPVSGSSFDGVFEVDVWVPKMSPTGTYRIGSVQLRDAVGNMATISVTDIEAKGYPTTFEQVGAGDTTAPQLQSLQLSPTTIDTSGADSTLTLSMHVTDAGSGLNPLGPYTSVHLRAPSGRVISPVLIPLVQPPDPHDGAWQFSMKLPRYSEQGTWRVAQLNITDVTGNVRVYTTDELASAGYPTTIQQLGAGDANAPVLVDFDFSPKSVSTAGGSQQITVTAHVTDDIVGVSSLATGYGVAVWFRSPSGTQSVSAAAHYGPATGTALDGVYVEQATLPQFSESGTWTVDHVSLRDALGNMRDITTAELAAAGFPTAFSNN